MCVSKFHEKNLPSSCLRVCLHRSSCEYVNAFVWFVVAYAWRGMPSYPHFYDGPFLRLRYPVAKWKLKQTAERTNWDHICIEGELLPRVFSHTLQAMATYGQSRKQVQVKKFSGKKQPHMPREKLTNAQHVPGPGAYDTKSSFGNQTMSSKTSPQKTKFGKDTRGTLDKTYISAEHSKKLPSNYSQEIFVGEISKVSAIGKQVSSSKKTAKSYGFGTSQRDHAAKQYVPQNF